MNKYFMHKRFEKIFGFIALFLALFAALLGDPYPESNPQEDMVRPLEIKGMQVDYIRAVDLAKWLMEKEKNFILIDSRLDSEFDNYHIPSAKNRIFFESISENVQPDRTIILYSDNNESSLEKWFELKQLGYMKVLLLDGGMRSWANEILFPDLSHHPGLSEEEIEKIRKTSLYFGGNPKLGEFYKGKTRKKYFREGC